MWRQKDKDDSMYFCDLEDRVEMYNKAKKQQHSLEKRPPAHAVASSSSETTLRMSKKRSDSSNHGSRKSDEGSVKSPVPTNSNKENVEFWKLRVAECKKELQHAEEQLALAMARDE